MPLGLFLLRRLRVVNHRDEPIAVPPNIEDRVACDGIGVFERTRSGSIPRVGEKLPNLGHPEVCGANPTSQKQDVGHPLCDEPDELDGADDDEDGAKDQPGNAEA